MKRLLTTLVILTGLVACDDADERFDVGYSDGVAVGYNTACQIRATLVEGDFDNVDYARGFAKGKADGVAACYADRKAGRR